jgi:hypothetical protein
MKLNPVKVWKDLSKCIEDIKRKKKYVKIVSELNDLGKLEEIGLKPDEDMNLYVGVNLNPELLFYSDISQEPVELKMISEKVQKYTEFLTKEGILDSIKVDYDRVKTEEYYGYILKISYKYINYTTYKFLYSIFYFSTLIVAFISMIIVAISIF